MKTCTKYFPPLVLGLGVLVLILGFFVTPARSQSPTGNNDWPLWTRNGQGSSVVYGAVSCTASDGSGADFLNSKSSYRNSIIIVNTHASVSLAFCPKGSTDASGAACSFSNGLLLKAGAAVTLDQSVLASGSAGFTCWGDSGTSTLRFWAEQ
jgi:hypothetical protein